MDRDARAAADLDQEVAAAGRRRPPRPSCADQAGGSCQPDDHVDLGLGELHDLGQLVHLGAGQAAADDHAGALDEALGLHPVSSAGSASRSDMVCEIIAMPDAALPVQPGQRVDPVDHAAPGPQRPPQLVEDDEVVPARLQAGVGQRLRDVDRAEPVRPAGQQCGGLQVGLGVVDAGHVEHDRAVAAHRLGRSAREKISPSRAPPARPISEASRPSVRSR